MLGIGAQWIAWRLALPAIVLMSLAGILAGPVSGLIDPAADFGDLLRPMISIAVAIILFEGGLTLNLRELREAGSGVMRLVLPGVPLAWGLGAAAAHYLAGFSWPVAVLFSGILVVTGPTVIIPLLRQAKLAPRPRAILKWEGIVNDPIGAILAVLVFEYLVRTSHGEPVTTAIGWVAFASLIAAAIGYLFGRLVAASFRGGLVPEFLKAPAVLCLVLACFEAANLVEHETGLLAVTAMGLTIANSKLASIVEMRRFKETVAVILVSGVFVLLTATLSLEDLQAADWRLGAFVAATLFMVRPLAVLCSMIGSAVPFRERLFIAWIAPRGIVAVAVSGFFAAALAEFGYPEAEQLVPYAFAIVFATVVLHGFSAPWLARRLDLVSAQKPGVLIVGASPWSLALACAFKELDVPVTVADTSWHRLKPVRLADIPTYFGEILSEATEEHLDMQQFGTLIAATGNEAYNALVCTEFAPEMDRANIFQLGGETEDDPMDLPFTLKGKRLFKPALSLDDLLTRHYRGWGFQKTTLTEEYGFDAHQANVTDEAEGVLILRASGRMTTYRSAETRPPGPGDALLTYVPPEPAAS